MGDRWREYRHRLELAGVKFIALLPGLLPLRISVKFGRLLGVLAFDIFRVRRRVTLENLDRAFGDELSRAEKVRIGRNSYINFAKSTIEFATLGRLRRDDLVGMVRIEGRERLDGALSAGKGVLAITGHFGSWEVLGAATVAHGYAADFLVGEQSNKLVNNMMNDLRRSAGIGVIERGIAARGIFASLKQGRIVALLGDQDARKHGVFVDFFGIPASTFQGAAQFAYRSGCPIVCVAIVRNDDETHTAIFNEPIRIRHDAEKEAEVLRLTAEHTRQLERFVRSYPDHYFWAHRRWKTKPPPGGGARADRREKDACGEPRD